MSKGISRISLAIIAVVVIVGGAAYAYYALQPAAPPQQVAPAPKPAPQPQQPAPVPKPPPAPIVMEKVKVAGLTTVFGATDLIVQAGKERSIWASNGLDPEFVTVPRSALAISDLKEFVSSGVKMGLQSTVDTLSARADGAPVKIVAGYTGDPIALKIFGKPDSTIKTPQELDGKKIGVISNTHSTARAVILLSQKFSIKPELVPLGNLSNSLAALKAGRIDAISSAEVNAYRLVDSGELKILVPSGDYYPKPWAAGGVWATDDLIKENPDLVKKFGKATLETVKYLKENPNYAADLLVKGAKVSKEVADKTVSLITWKPGGRGSGKDLAAALTNSWEVGKATGAVPASANVKIDEAVDIRFLQ